MKYCLLSCAALALMACQADKAEPKNEMPAGDSPVAVSYDKLPPITQALACFKNDLPAIALHRGRDRGKNEPENAFSSLKSAKAGGYVFAEIDIAQLKDGTLILFHDGVWDEKSTGKGPVASSVESDLDNILLTLPNGELAAERPTRLTDVLEWADQDIYLEIDFKSSADYGDVIDAIKAYEMNDYVILIAYTDEQAEELKTLAPNMTLSRGDESREYPNDLVWLGTSGEFETSNFYTGYGQFSARRDLPENWKDLALLVTDYPDELRTKIKAKPDRLRLDECLSQ